MDELGLDPAEVALWFEQESKEAFELIRVSEEAAASLAEVLGIPVRRCYVSDAVLEARAIAQGVPKAEILKAVLPDPGSVMAGDFGEILAYLYHAGRHAPRTVIGPKKWRLKQDRTKPCPHSDVVQFILPDWPEPSDQDRLICAEVKCKSTNGPFRPVARAIEDCVRDRTSRLSRTLVWLRERALLSDAVDTDVAILNRFIQADAYPAATKEYNAVAVVCADLLQDALEDVPAENDPSYSVIVITVPQLHRVYNAVFAAVVDGDAAAGSGAEE